MAKFHSYQVGDVALECDVDTSPSAEHEARIAASSLKPGNGAFIRRSDRAWRYAVVSEVSGGSRPSITFFVMPDSSTKTVGMNHWGTRVRPLKSPLQETVKSVNTEFGSSNNTMGLTPFSSQGSAHIENVASRAMSEMRRSNGDDGSFSSKGQSAEELEDDLPKQRQRPTDAPRRRTSLTNMAADIFKRFSSVTLDDEDDEDADLTSANLNRAATNPRQYTPNAPKRRTSLTVMSAIFQRLSSLTNDEEDNHVASDRMESPANEDKCEPKKSLHAESKGHWTPGKTEPDNRRTNNRQRRGSFNLTTSLIFQNLMKGVDSEEAAEEPAVGRRGFSIHDLAEDGDDNEAPSEEHPSLSFRRHKPISSRRRATVSEMTGEDVAPMRTMNGVDSKEAFEQPAVGRRGFSVHDLAEDGDDNEAPSEEQPPLSFRRHKPISSRRRATVSEMTGEEVAPVRKMNCANSKEAVKQPSVGRRGFSVHDLAEDGDANEAPSEEQPPLSFRRHKPMSSRRRATVSEMTGEDVAPVRKGNPQEADRRTLCKKTSDDQLPLNGVKPRNPRRRATVNLERPVLNIKKGGRKSSHDVMKNVFTKLMEEKIGTGGNAEQSGNPHTYYKPRNNHSTNVQEKDDIAPMVQPATDRRGHRARNIRKERLSAPESCMLY